MAKRKKKKTTSKKPTAAEIKNQILKKLDELDIKQLTHLTGGKQSTSDPESLDWSRVIWTVWRR
jgi:hypothetical protein